MKTRELEEMVQEALRSWSIIRRDLQGYKDFLDGAYLVLAHGRGQTVLGNNQKLPFDEIKDYEGLSIEIRFPSLNIEAIQALKEHKLVDRERTPMTLASIKVVLKTGSRKTG